MNFGQAVKLCREYRKLTQTELAARSTLSHSYINKLENNRRTVSGYGFLDLCQALDISPLTLVYLAMEETEKKTLTNSLHILLRSYAYQDLKRSRP